MLPMLAAIIAACLAAGCSSDWPMALSWPPHVIAGTYWSEQAVGALGTLALSLERVEHSRVFDAVMTSRDDEELGESEGIGTLGNEHLILNFDRGKLDDYYFEGSVVRDGEIVLRIEGQFIFPDRSQTVPVVFLKR